MGRKQYQHISEVQAWLNMLRISNAPTIISNVMVGLALAIQSHALAWSDYSLPPRLDFPKILIVITVAMLLMYFSGMLFNDAMDAKWDKKHRPNRPIPSGVIKRNDAWLTASFMMVCAVLLCGMQQGTLQLSIVLSLAVLAYTFFHRWLFPAAILMALSRSLVYFIAMTALSPPPPFGNLLGFCIAIGVYTTILTVLGRNEHDDNTKHAWLTWLMLIPPIIPLVMYGEAHEFTWMMLVIYVAWVCMAWRDFRKPNSQPIAGMHKLLAGFCLLDCVLIAMIGEISIMIVSLICFVFAVAAHRRVMGT